MMICLLCFMSAMTHAPFINFRREGIYLYKEGGKKPNVMYSCGGKEGTIRYISDIYMYKEQRKEPNVMYNGGGK